MVLVRGFLTLIFFPKGNKDGEEYDGRRNLEDLLIFINEKSGTIRDGNGQLTFKAGIVISLDALVKDFVSASNDEKKAVTVYYYTISIRIVRVMDGAAILTDWNKFSKAQHTLLLQNFNMGGNSYGNN